MTSLGFALIGVACLVWVLGTSAASAIQVSTPEAADEAMYYDPNGLFAAPIPTNWIAEDQDGYVRIVTQDEQISISIVVVAGSSATTAIGDAIQIVSDDFQGTPVPDPQATPAAGDDSVALFTFDDGSSGGTLIQVYARVVGGNVFVMVLRGDLETIKLRQVQVDKIWQGVLIDTEAAATPVA
ncbi:MAG: hypothetical protein KC438_01025 [Thermomicrobiales bacterium]|nr:hypothetical protein [Thermomicrobiales bacterium]MCO5219979.1 hypothetical protein [Thermomicrobiales bacterium]